MNVLHISRGFAQNPLYSHLIRHLNILGHHQTIFAPVRSATELSRQPDDLPGMLEYKYRRILKPVHRVLFRRKVRTIFRELRDCINPNQFDLVHAHTLYSDGAVALRVKRQFDLPYIVAVRNTDLNFFMRLRPDLRWLARDVLTAASKVIFISPAYREKLLARIDSRSRNEIERKSVVVPNGLSSDWLDDFERPIRAVNKPLRLLYVGDFTSNKNVQGILDAASLLVDRVPVEVTLVGSGGSQEKPIRAAIRSGKYPFATYKGRINDRQVLRSVYRDHDILLMPSFRETFGVVYLEALSQGLPVVHSRGEGIDGLFPPGTVSEAVDPTSAGSIAAGTDLLAARLDQVRPTCITEAQKFGWDSIAMRYEALYQTISSA